jgi:hypothetical protein
VHRSASALRQFDRILMRDKELMFLPLMAGVIIAGVVVSLVLA